MRRLLTLPQFQQLRPQRHGGPIPPDRGSALILIPAWILILVLLGGIAVDTAAVHMAQRRGNRQLAMIVADAAQIVDTSHLLTTGDMQLHSEGAQRVVHELIEHTNFPGSLHSQPEVIIDVEAGTVTANLELQVPHIFLNAAPTTSDYEIVPIRATAVFVP